MNIEDDIRLHSHYITELYNKENDLRERLNEMKETQINQSIIAKQNSENIMDILKIIKETQSELYDLKSKHEVLKIEKSGVRMAIESIRNPKNWIPIVALILLIESLKGLEIAKLIKYFTGL